MSGNTQREMLGSRLGFLLLSAGCAIGLGNVWRFPYITGAYGGAIFVGIYLLCLFAVVPTMIMEFAVGRAARRNMGLAFHILEPKGSKWHWGGKVALIGSYLLMMFYTTVTGWMLYYCWYMASGALSGLDAAGVGKFFGATLGDPVAQVVGMTLVVLMGCGVCAMGVQKGVERVVKLMMLGLLFILMALVIRSLTLPGAEAGVSFYLSPDPSKLEKTGLFPVINAAMNQAFFTLSVGIGAMCIFGSYQGKDRSLTGEAMWIMGLDTFVALMAGLIIFPACFAFSVAPNSGPGLMFIFLPNVISRLPGGPILLVVFFLAVLFAALTSLVNLFEAPTATLQELFHLKRPTAVAIIGALGVGIGLVIAPIVSDWMDVCSIYICPIGALLAGVMFFWVCGKDYALEQVNLSRSKPLGRWFYPMAKYLFCGVTLLVLILGAVKGGIG